MAKAGAKLKKIDVKLNMPLLNISGTWEADESEIKAAWELYVELCTRITVAKLKPGEGLLREALSSYHSLFNVTREIMKTYGPTIAIPKGKDKDLCFGFLAISLLNNVLRPLLSKYHPLLLDYENRKKTSCSSVEHEANWEYAEALRSELERVRKVAIGFANCLADVAGVKSLIME